MADMTATITRLETYGECGWEWETLFNEFGRTWKSVARTNEQGNGLWIQGKQIEGTGQFSLPHSRAAALKRIIANAKRAGYETHAE